MKEKEKTFLYYTDNKRVTLTCSEKKLSTKYFADH